MVVEYPKRVYKGDESIVVNTKEEEMIFLGVCKIDKENESGIPSEVGKGEEPQQAKPVEEASPREACGSGEIQTHEGQGRELPVRMLKRKPGRPHSKI